jgi:hypothetical protein
MLIETFSKSRHKSVVEVMSIFWVYEGACWDGIDFFPGWLGWNMGTSAGKRKLPPPNSESELIPRVTFI